MTRRRSRPALGVEALDSRIVLSTIGSTAAVSQGAVEVAAQTMKAASTTTTLNVNAGTLGSPIKFTVSVRAAASAGSPEGTVNITDHGNVIETLTLSPSTSSSSKYATSDATATLAQQPGGGAYYFGKHQLVATFVPSGSFSKSVSNKTFTVSQPHYTTLAGNVKIATVVPGSGAAIQSGQTANVLYTGYLVKNGQIFDDSVNDGGTPFTFSVGAGQVIPGFDAGVVGMQVGETRLVEIPAAQGYGSQSNGAIPANSTLIFALTLESFT